MVRTQGQDFFMHGLVVLVLSRQAPPPPEAAGCGRDLFWGGVDAGPLDAGLGAFWKHRIYTGDDFVDGGEAEALTLAANHLFTQTLHKLPRPGANPHGRDQASMQAGRRTEHGSMHEPPC